jgi:hypothetical protein
MHRRQDLISALARLMSPLVERSGRLTMPPFALGSYREFCTSALFQSVTHEGIDFDPVIEIQGADRIEPASILVSGHFYLNFLFIRWVNDNVARPGVFLLHRQEKWLLQGSRQPMDILLPGRSSLLRARDVLNAGRPVIGAIDAIEPSGKAWAKTAVSSRDDYASRSLLTYAIRSGTPLFFFDTFFDGSGRINAVVEPIASRDPLGDYSRLLSEALARRQGASRTEAPDLSSRPVPGRP